MTAAQVELWGKLLMVFTFYLGALTERMPVWLSSDAMHLLIISI